MSLTGTAGAMWSAVTPEELRHRSMEFAVRTVRFCRVLPRNWEARHIGAQLIGAATSVAMNYRAAGRGRSHREFTAKLGVVTEEADESLGWLELISKLQLADGSEILWLLAEARELVAIFGSSYRTAKEKDRR
ncbi:MAG: four helix bundle protein [Acidobacteriota bacterium]